MYRRLSDFDQTSNLKYEYRFEDQSEEEGKIIKGMEFGDLERQVLQEEIQDVLATNFKSSQFIYMSKKEVEAVSYTHLTLPTIYSV